MSTLDTTIPANPMPNTSRSSVSTDAVGVEEALKPFALVAEQDIGADESDMDTYRPGSEKYRKGPRITVGHFRRAREALAALRSAPPQQEAGPVAWLFEWAPHQHEQWTQDVSQMNPAAMKHRRFRNITPLVSATLADETLRAENERLRDKVENVILTHRQTLERAEAAEAKLAALAQPSPEGRQAEEVEKLSGVKSCLEALSPEPTT